MKYEYSVESFTYYDQYGLENKLSRYGQRGWELCTIVGGLFIFKRQME